MHSYTRTCMQTHAHSLTFEHMQRLQLGYKHWFQLELGTALIHHGLEVARKHKVDHAALIVTSFCRLVLAKARTFLRKKQNNTPRCQLQTLSRSRINRRCQLQNCKPRRAGRPHKRKRTRSGAGRPRSRQVTLTSLCL